LILFKQYHQIVYQNFWNFSWLYLLWGNFCRRYCEWWSCQVQKAIVRMYLINDAIVLIVDMRLRLPTEILLKGMQKE